MRVIPSVIFGFAAGWIGFALGIEISGAMQTHRPIAEVLSNRNTWWFLIVSLRYVGYLFIPAIVALVLSRLPLVVRLLCAAAAGCIAGIIIANHVGIMNFFP